MWHSLLVDQEVLMSLVHIIALSATTGLDDGKVIWPVKVSSSYCQLGLQCFDTVGWLSGRASGL